MAGLISWEQLSTGVQKIFQRLGNFSGLFHAFFALTLTCAQTLTLDAEGTLTLTLATLDKEAATLASLGGREGGQGRPFIAPQISPILHSSIRRSSLPSYLHRFPPSSFRPFIAPFNAPLLSLPPSVPPSLPSSLPPPFIVPSLHRFRPPLRASLPPSLPPSVPPSLRHSLRLHLLALSVLGADR